MAFANPKITSAFHRRRPRAHHGRLPDPAVHPAARTGLEAIAIVAVRGFLRAGTMRTYWRRDKPTFAIASAALLGVLVFDLLPGLIIAVALSLILFIAYASAPRVAVLGRTGEGDFVEASSRSDLAGTRPPHCPARWRLVRRQRGSPAPRRDRPGRRGRSAGPGGLPGAQAQLPLGLPVLETLGALEDDLRRSGAELWLAAVPGRARPRLEQDQPPAFSVSGELETCRFLHGF
jgi:sulfate permease, SulP family